MSWFEIYLWTRLSAFEILFGVGIGASIITCILLFILGIMRGETCYKKEELYKKEIKEWNKNRPSYQKWLKRIIVLLIFFIMCQVFIPSKKDFAIIYILPKLTNSEIIKQIPEDFNEIYKLGIKELKDSIKTETTK